MGFDFYLSEMSVSDLHGGGLTLQRILGDDLLDIPNFVYVDRFAADMPASPKFADRSIYIEPFWQRDIVRKKTGNSLAASLGKKLFMVKRYAAVAAKLLDKKFEGNDIPYGLICPQGANSIFTLEALKALRPVKYVTWIMDDHLLEFVNGEWQYPKGVEPVFKKHLQDAQHVFVISPAMRQFYHERFGVESTVLFGSSDTVAVEGAGNKESEGAIKIGYFGAVAGWQMDALAAVAKAITGTKTQLHIYSGIEKLPEVLNLPGVTFEGKLKPDQVLPAMLNYDAVLLPIGFSDKFRNMSQFNIATKMSEYLASSVAILTVGPPYAAMMQYLQGSNAAITVSSAQKEEILKGINLLQDDGFVTEILKNARNLVATETGNQPMRNRWLSVVNA